MSIQFSRSYQASDGKCYATLEEAQVVEVRSVLEQAELTCTEVQIEEVATHIVRSADAIVNILTLNDSSRPRARGVKKPRKPKAQPAP